MSSITLDLVKKISAFLPKHSKKLHSIELSTHILHSGPFQCSSTHWGKGHLIKWYSFFINHDAIRCIGQIVCFIFIQIIQSVIMSRFTKEYFSQWRVWRRAEMWTLETQHLTHQRIVLGEAHHHFIIFLSSSYHHHNIIISSLYHHHIIIISSGNSASHSPEDSFR